MDINVLTELVRANKYNAENIFYHSLQHLEDLGIKAVTGTMPMIALLEHQAVTTAVTNSELDLINRYLNPNYCDTHESLARHLDYTTLPQIHATPGSIPVTLGLLVSDLEQTSYTLEDGSKRVVIPEDTIIGYKDEVFFGIHHAIEITLLGNDTINVSYIDNTNPLVELENPVIESVYRKADPLTSNFTGDVLELQVSAYQFKREYNNYPVNASLGFNKTYTISDQYYHARVFSRVGNEWVELTTYFSEFIYNATSETPAAVVKLEGDKLTINIPQIYFNRGLIGTEVKVVVYSTKGNYSADYRFSTLPDWSVEFKNTDSRYALLVEPLANFKLVYAYSSGLLSGGGNIPDLETLKTKVLTGSTDEDPVTPSQLETKVKSLGYNLVHELNYISDNLYVASKRVSDITLTDSTVLVEAGGLDLLLQKLGDVYGCINNGNNYTLTPNILAKLDNGVISLKTSSEVTAFNNLGREAKIAQVNDGNYLTTPFYYLIEQLDFNRQVAVFDLDSPQVTKRDYIGTNQNNIGLISTKEYSLVKSATGYTLNLTAITNDTFLNYQDESFIPQLTLTDASGIMYSINGIFNGRGDDGEFYYKFILGTSYDLSYLNTIVLDTVTRDNTKLTADLTSKFKLTYNLVKELPTNVDEVFKTHTEPSKLPNQYQTITYETLTLEFGTQLSGIYTPTETLAGATEFQVYANDVLAYYKEDVYQTDESGYISFTPNPDYPSDPDADPILYNKLHSAGDQIFELDGTTPVYAHRKGSPVLDSNNQPVPIDRDTHAVLTKLLLINYKYKMVSGYYESIKAEVLTNLTNDIEPLEQAMLGLTELKYNLSNSLGKVNVRFDSKTTAYINSSLDFDLTVTVDPVTYSDGDLRTMITGNINTVISNYVRTANFATNELIAQINNLIESTVEGFSIDSISGLGNSINFRLVNPNDIIGLKSSVSLDVDNTYRLLPDINITYKLAQ